MRSTLSPVVKRDEIVKLYAHHAFLQTQKENSIFLVAIFTSFTLLYRALCCACCSLVVRLYISEGSELFQQLVLLLVGCSQIPGFSPEVFYSYNCL